MMSDRDLDALEDDLNSLDNEEEADGWRRYLRFAPMILAGGAFILFSFIVLIAYWGDGGEEPAQQVAAPILTPQTALKIEPEEPGGIEIPDQDKLVYNELSQGADDGQVEQILPGAEEPRELPKPVAEAAKPPSDVAAIPAPGDVGSVPPPGDVDTSLLAEPQTPAPEAPETPAGDKPAADAMATDGAKPSEKPADGDVATAAQVPLVIPDQPQTPAPDGATPTAQTPILNGAKTPSADKPMTDTAAVVKPSTGTAKPVTTTQMRTLAGVYRIQIASLRSPTLAEREWSSQVKKNPDLLSKLSLTVQRAVIKNNGTYYRVQAGPLRDRESADTLCQDLRSRGQDCIVVRP